MQLKRAERHRISKCTLQNLKEDYERFQVEGEGKRSKVKHFNNVLHLPFLDIPLTQVCPRYEFIASVQSAWQAGKRVFLLT